MKSFILPGACLITLLVAVMRPAAVFTKDNSAHWEGVDKSVIEKVAQEHGRNTHAPFINTGQGDLLLFVFLLAGASGGFMAGYYWHMLISEKQKNKSSLAKPTRSER